MIEFGFTKTTKNRAKYAVKKGRLWHSAQVFWFSRKKTKAASLGEDYKRRFGGGQIAAGRRYR